jgi:hypothetical protein
VAKRAKTPLLAGGAAVVGLVGALAARALTNGHKSGPMDSVRKALPGKSNKRRLKGSARNISQSVSDVAKQADKIGQRVSTVANAVQRVSESADDAVKKA